MSWTSPLHRRDHHHALLLTRDALHEFLEIGDRGLHRLRALQHERQLHLARAEQLADDLHPVEQDLVDDRERLVASSSRSSRSSVRPGLSPSMIRFLSTSSMVSARILTTAASVLSLNESTNASSGSLPSFQSLKIRFSAPMPLFFRNLVQRDDLRHVDDRRGQAALLRVREEHRVEHVTRRRIEAEADVREPEQRLALGQLLAKSARSRRAC